VLTGKRKETFVGDGAELDGRSVLVVEDEFLLAMELQALLEQRGCTVLGPVPTIGQALAMLDRAKPEVAVLDVNLKGQRATPVAAALQDRVVLITGYSKLQLNEPELRDAPRLDKPVNGRDLKCALAHALKAAGNGQDS
jgi:two-component system, response regulator PdtaR